MFISPIRHATSCRSIALSIRRTMSATTFNGEDVYIQLPQIRLGARRFGKKDHPLLVALHGWLDNASSFEPLARRLSGEYGYQVLAVDWPGHGLSEHRPGMYPLHFTDYMLDLDMLLKHLDHDKEYRTPTAIIGHSMGGLISSAFSATHPNRVKKLVVIEAVSPMYEKPGKSKARLVRATEKYDAWLLKMHMRALAGEDTSKPRIVYESVEVAVQARAKLTGMDAEWCRLLCERNLSVHEGGVAWRSDPRLRMESLYRSSFEHVDSLMTHVETTTLMIAGDKGFEDLRKAMPNARRWYTKLQECTVAGDHHPHLSNATDVAKAIADYLSAEDSVEEIQS
ncbi:hypothetical protein SARC_05626 [Sphaeroforma arctica JP610]|uniref:Serine aminopeptidase S33 domain-containing protein n=1 Tax=Sphaeroforma arctica JP610 TaxID=667725 RepID=A0A0L0FZ41_9EUKA|nr:hypothetical protein SARC_05626 [Sphaeroforma arctica JP610]KNC82075.1 hypothetical protein SARC_05626 [Sphaeroforma arctica JP610]|eukprot:XP_014155977.1 hypothetical protein SARC_05626 [Sphaeroforma arctica JP610]